MVSETVEIEWVDELTEEESEEIGLDETELGRLEFFAEHPELMDPLIYFLPGRK